LSCGNRQMPLTSGRSTDTLPILVSTYRQNAQKGTTASVLSERTLGMNIPTTVGNFYCCTIESALSGYITVDRQHGPLQSQNLTENHQNCFHNHLPRSPLTATYLYHTVQDEGISRYHGYRTSCPFSYLLCLPSGKRYTSISVHTNHLEKTGLKVRSTNHGSTKSSTRDKVSSILSGPSIQLSFSLDGCRLLFGFWSPPF
ncbi:hypothetical protein P4O66_022665, partial [Electrophorus voltai]